MKPFPLLLPALVFAILAPTAFAGTIANNGAPDQWLGSFSDYDQGQQSGDNFTLGTSATATQIQWWGFYLSGNTPPAQDNFTIGFFKITAGVPSSVPLFSYLVGNAVGRADSGLNTTAFGSDLDIFSYNALIPSSSFLPGSYLLSIVNNTAADTDDEWAWASSESSGTGMEWDPTLMQTLGSILPDTNSPSISLAPCLRGEAAWSSWRSDSSAFFLSAVAWRCEFRVDLRLFGFILLLK